jgi:hypothetical protein
MKKVASLRYGVIFKKAFCDPAIFSAFVHDFLGITLEIDRVETEKSFDPPIGRVTPRYDLFAEDQKNRVIVDIQHERYTDHYDRFLHYHCAAILEQVVSSYDYRPPLRVYTLVVLTSGDKHQRDIVMTDFDPRDLKGKPLGEIGHKIMYLCPKYVTEETPAPYREWLLAIADSLDEEVEESTYHHPEIQKIFQYIEKDRVSPDERARMIEEYHQQEKFEEGIEAGKMETAKRMLAEGMEVALIAKFTELSETTILTLKSEL